MVQKTRNKGADTNKHVETSVKLDAIEARQLKKIKQHYGFKTNSEAIRALLRSASMQIDLKK